MGSVGHYDRVRSVSFGDACMLLCSWCAVKSLREDDGVDVSDREALDAYLAEHEDIVFNHDWAEASLSGEWCDRCRDELASPLCDVCLDPVKYDDPVRVHRLMPAQEGMLCGECYAKSTMGYDLGTDEGEDQWEAYVGQLDAMKRAKASQLSLGIIA